MAELEGITPTRARTTQVSTNNISSVYSNALSTAGVSNNVSLQTLLELFWLGSTSIFENVSISGDASVGDDLSVVDDAVISGSTTIGGGLVVTGAVTATGAMSAPTGVFSVVEASSLNVTNLLSSQNLFGQLTYSYQNTGTFTVASISEGATNFLAATQSIGRIHAGMYLTNSTYFSNVTVVTSVNYTNRLVYIDKGAKATGTDASASFWGTGTYVHVVPSSYSRCRVTVTGGGGAGGSDEDDVDGGGGGGAGGTSIGWWTLSTGSTYAVTVGSGGAGTTNGASPVSGGTSSFGALQTATGGGGGGPGAAMAAHLQ